MRLFSSIAFLTSILTHAQGSEKTVKTDSGTVVLHYFTTGQLSTKQWMDTDDRWGHSWAYAMDGREIINYQTRKIGGHASVYFSYYPNGAISKAEVSDAPDGGIQWYRSTTTYDERGVRIGFTEQGQGNDGPIPGIEVRTTQKPEVTAPFKQEVVKEQRMFITEVFVVNASKYTCRMDAVVKNPSPAMQNGNYTMAPGDTLRIGMYSTGETYDEAAKHVTITAKRWSRKARKQLAYRILREEVTAAEPEARKYFVVIGL
ncbi:MAG: hypothetical protein ABI599_06415 [Flavobacteriales bacterium]